MSSFWETPERTRGVNLLSDTRFNRFLLGFVPFALVVREENGERDVIRVFLNNLLQAPAVGVLFAFFIEVNNHGSPRDGAVRLDIETRFPSYPSAKPARRRFREMTSTRSATMKAL